MGSKLNFPEKGGMPFSFIKSPGAGAEAAGEVSFRQKGTVDSLSEQEEKGKNLDVFGGDQKGGSLENKIRSCGVEISESERNQFCKAEEGQGEEETLKSTEKQDNGSVLDKEEEPAVVAALKTEEKRHDTKILKRTEEADTGPHKTESKTGIKEEVGQKKEGSKEVRNKSEAEARRREKEDKERELEETKEEKEGQEPLSGRLLIKQKQKNLPDRPGVYRMISASGKVLYVGKAKSLKKRVLNYTQPERLTLRIKQMVSLTRDLIVVECQSEAEAFLLENDLIKRYQPYYNILLKDDKSFPYILIRQNHPFPQVLKYRGKQSAKGKYFGPYASIGAVQEALSTIQKVFQLRVCTDHDFETRSRPCLLYQIKKCSGPCCGMISGEEYRKNVRQALDFMEGKSQRLQKEFSEKMYEASQKEDYETALLYREKIKALNLVQAQSTEHEGYEINGDVFALYREGGSACVQVLFFRSGANKGSKAFFFDQLEEGQTDGGLLQSVLGQFYESVRLPKEIILSHEVEEKELLRESFSQKAGFKIKIETNVRSGRRKILQKALLNAQEALRRHFLEKEVSERDWKGFEELAGLKDIEKIEVYDNSHLQGTSSVGAMIAAGPEGFLKNRYRRFNIDIQTVNPQDDFDMMRHVLTRRLSRGLKEGDLPDVMLIDGGKGQLSAVQEIFGKFPGASKIALIGVAKGPNRDAGEEKLYFPDREEPVCLPKNNNVLHFIQRLRDEAHRFAIGSHRIKRKNNFFRNPLDEIEGIGPKKKKALVEYFGSASKVAQAQVIELIRVPGINRKLAQVIYDFFHS